MLLMIWKEFRLTFEGVVIARVVIDRDLSSRSNSVTTRGQLRRGKKRLKNVDRRTNFVGSDSFQRPRSTFTNSVYHRLRRYRRPYFSVLHGSVMWWYFSVPRSTIMESIYARKRPYTLRFSPYTAVFWRFTWFRITIVYLRIVYGEKRLYTGKYGRKRSSYTDSVCEGRKRSFFFSVYHHISPYTTRRYTIVILYHVNRRISPYTIVYDRAGLTWVWSISQDHWMM